MTRAETLVEEYNSHPQDSDHFIAVIEGEVIDKWEVPIDYESPVMIYQMSDGSMVIIPEGSSATAIDPSRKSAIEEHAKANFPKPGLPLDEEGWHGLLH